MGTRRAGKWRRGLGCSCFRVAGCRERGNHPPAKCERFCGRESSREWSHHCVVLRISCASAPWKIRARNVCRGWRERLCLPGNQCQCGIGANTQKLRRCIVGATRVPSAILLDINHGNACASRVAAFRCAVATTKSLAVRSTLRFGVFGGSTRCSIIRVST